MSSFRSKPIAAALFSAALLMSSTAAQASATVAPSAVSVSPWVALSAFGTPAAVTSLCAAGAAAATQGTAVAQAAGQGCVLPVMDAAPPPVVHHTPAPAPLPAATPAGIGIWPLLLGLAAVTAVVFLIIRRDGDRERLTPISP